MNQKTIIGALVGGVILFIWQFLSWTMLNLHGESQKYTAKQNEILQYLVRMFLKPILFSDLFFY